MRESIYDARMPTGTTRTMRRRVGDLVASAAGLVVLVACGFVVRDGTVGSVELSVFHAVNGLPDALTPVMNAAQLLGVLAIGPVVALVALLLRRWRLAIAALLVTAGKLLGERTVWEIVQRSRPGRTISDAIVRGNTPERGISFVSGHVVLVTGLAWVITPYLRGRWRIVPWLVVAFVSLARVYLGAHAPLDVVGGVGLGLVVGGLTNLAVGVPGADGRSRDPSEVPD
jgi:membrane-associated phospholipid phosphatase